MKLLLRGRTLVAIVAILVVVGVVLWIRDLLAVDRCLDHGGRWNYDEDACEGITRPAD
jgi:hypothetical protein